MKRRSILEHARDKISKLRELVEEIGPRSVSRTLIYASAKARPKDAPKQILSVNELLNELNISFHQVTSKETASGQASVYLDRFANGELQVLTAMKVLDEGVDLPQTDTAILLASSSVEREWVQRRGRVLRTAPNKSKAAIYDFLVVPRDLGSNYAGSVLKSELARALAFSDDASNEWLPYGPRTLISKYEQHRFRRETNGE
jgi:superfamily II DNA or RNA helicase